ncbi:MAG: lipid-binding SYLF domain-containing protein [Proteobacteria bacterium]|nr:lipid-binding SYLF domain-containing protein [Pseudomonadota bacterium]
MRVNRVPYTVAAIVGALLMATGLNAGSAQAGEAQDLVDKAALTVKAFQNDPDMGSMRILLQRAEGVLILPQMLKAGFIIGGEGGSGVMLTRRGDSWSAPAFYTMGAGSIGLQFGAQASEMVLVFMTKRAVDAVLFNKVKLGADASVAAGPIGVGVEAGTTTNFREDVYSYSKSKGLFAGASVEGAVIEQRESLNRAYYGTDASPEEILFKHRVNNDGAKALREALNAMLRTRT